MKFKTVVLYLKLLKNVYIDKLDNIVAECNNMYHRTIKYWQRS